MANARRKGERAWFNGNLNNPYKRDPDRSEWQSGYDASEEARKQEWRAYNERREALWNVPERARDAYMAMEDDFAPSTVLDFMLAMRPETE